MLPFNVGSSATIKKIFTEEDLKSYADASGDFNPANLDAEYASKTKFKRPIVHGMLVSGLISSILGTRLPGEGTIYLNQTLSFRAPVYPGDEITTKVEVLKIREDKPVITLSTNCVNQKNEMVIEGEAVVLFPH